MKIIKSYTYNVVSTEPFDIPLPVEFELMHGNKTLATYTVHEDERVDYEFADTVKEPILTSTARPLVMNDIYFLFASRVFPDKMPFTETELKRFGIEEYNPYRIIRKTHGIMPTDSYWIRFKGEDFNYKKVMDNYDEYFNPNPKSSSKKNKADETKKKGDSAIYSIDSILEQKSHEYSSIHDVSSILNESKLDVDSLISNIDDIPEPTETPFAPASPAPPPSSPSSEPQSGGGNMSPEEISELLAVSEVTEESAPDDPEKTSLILGDVEVKVNKDHETE